MDEKGLKKAIQQIVELNQLTLVQAMPISNTEFIPLPNMQEVMFLWQAVYDLLRKSQPTNTDFDKDMAQFAQEKDMTEAEARTIFKQVFLNTCRDKFISAFVLRYKQTVLDAAGVAMWDATQTIFKFSEEELKQRKRYMVDAISALNEKSMKEHYGLPTSRGGSEKDVPPQQRKAYADRVKELYPQWVQGKKDYMDLPKKRRNTATFLGDSDYTHFPSELVDKIEITRPSELALLHAAKEFKFDYSLSTLKSYFDDYYEGFKTLAES